MTFDQIMDPQHLISSTEESIAEELKAVGITIPTEQLRSVIMSAAMNAKDSDRAAVVSRYRAARHAPVAREARRYGYHKRAESLTPTMFKAVPPKIPAAVEIKHENEFMRNPVGGMPAPELELIQTGPTMPGPDPEKPGNVLKPLGLFTVSVPDAVVESTVETPATEQEPVTEGVEPTLEDTLKERLSGGVEVKITPLPTLPTETPKVAPTSEQEGLNQVQSIKIPGFRTDGEPAE